VPPEGYVIAVYGLAATAFQVAAEYHVVGDSVMGVVFSLDIERVMDDYREDHRQEVVNAAVTLRTKMTKARDRARTVVELARVLPDCCKMEVTCGWQLQNPVCRFERTDLVAVWKAVGRLKVSEKTLVNAEQRLVRVYLVTPRYPGISFTYTMTLPEDSGSRCKIEEVTSTYKQLVCTI